MKQVRAAHRGRAGATLRVEYELSAARRLQFAALVFGLSSSGERRRIYRTARAASARNRTDVGFLSADGARPSRRRDEAWLPPPRGVEEEPAVNLGDAFGRDLRLAVVGQQAVDLLLDVGELRVAEAREEGQAR